MPIVFAQPEPVNPSISQGAGAAEQWSRDLPALARQQESIADLYARAAQAHAAGGGGGGALQAQLQNNALQAQSQMQGEQQAHEGQMLNARLGSQEGMQAQHIGAQYGLQQQHADLQQRLASTALSQAESLRLQRMRTALGAVREQVDSGHLTAEEGSQLQLQIQTGINPLEQRRAQSQLDAAELQYSQAEHQAARQDQLWNERQRFHASSLQSRLQSLIDPETGEERQFYVDQNGNPSPVDFGAGGGPRGRQAQSGDSASPRQGQPNHTAIMAQARANAVAAAGRDANGHAAPVTTDAVMAEYRRLMDTFQPPQDPQVSQADVRRQVWQDIAHNFPELPIAERRRMLEAVLPQRLREERAARQPSPAVQAAEERARADEERRLGAAVVGGQNFRPLLDAAVQRRQRQAAPPRAEEARPGTPQPFPMTSDNGPLPDGREPAIDRERLSPAQLVVVQQFDTARSRARALPPARQETLLPLIDRAERLRARYGQDVSAMPPAVRRQYNQWIDVIDRLPAPARRPAESPQENLGVVENWNRTFGRGG